MTYLNVECAEIRSRFVAGGVPTGPEVEAHLQACPHCRELCANQAQLGRALALTVSAVPEASDLFALVEGDLGREQGLRARLRELPTRARVAALLALPLVLVTWHFAQRRRVDFAEYSAAVFWLVMLLLAGTMAWGAARLLRGPRLSLRAAGRERAVALALLLTPALVLLLVPFGSGSEEWADAYGSPATCFRYGVLLTAPFLLLFRLLDRRESVPGAASISAGALAGIAASLLLHAHCASGHFGHLLLGHATIGAAWAVVLSLLPRLLPARSR